MKIILASKSGVRKKILDSYKIENEVIVSMWMKSEIKSHFWLKVQILYLYLKI